MASATILIIEDDTSKITHYKKFFSQAGIDVTTASKDEDVLQKASDIRPTLVIIDVILPKTNGLSIMRKLHAQTETKGIPVIMLTADDKKTQGQALEDSVQKLVAITQGILDGHASRKATTQK